MIDAYFPTCPKIELFARGPADGWNLWGNEAPDPVNDTSVNAPAEPDGPRVLPSAGERLGEDCE